MSATLEHRGWRWEIHPPTSSVTGWRVASGEAQGYRGADIAAKTEINAQYLHSLN